MVATPGLQEPHGHGRRPLPLRTRRDVGESITIAAVATAASHRGPGSDGAEPLSLAILAAPSAMALAIRVVPQGVQLRIGREHARGQHLEFLGSPSTPVSSHRLRMAVPLSPVPRSLSALVSSSIDWLNLAMAMSCLDGKYMATVRGATSAFAAMSAIVVAS